MFVAHAGGLGSGRLPGTSGEPAGTGAPRSCHSTAYWAEGDTRWSTNGAGAPHTRHHRNAASSVTPQQHCIVSLPEENPVPAATGLEPPDQHQTET